MTSEKCGNCAYFQRGDNRCRRYPPHWASPGSRAIAAFPDTYEHQWCGEWKASPHVEECKKGNHVMVKTTEPMYEREGCFKKTRIGTKIFSDCIHCDYGEYSEEEDQE